MGTYAQWGWNVLTQCIRTHWSGLYLHFPHIFDNGHGPVALIAVSIVAQAQQGYIDVSIHGHIVHFGPPDDVLLEQWGRVVSLGD